MSNWLSGNYNLHIELFVINEGVTPVAALCPSERLLFHANMPVYPRVGLNLRCTLCIHCVFSHLSHVFILFKVI